MLPSYEALYKIIGLIFHQLAIGGKGARPRLPTQDLAVFAVENLDQFNKNGITVTGKNSNGLKVTSIQAVLWNANEVITWLVRIYHGVYLRGTSSFVSGEEDPNISTYLVMFIGDICQQKGLIVTDN